jgi:ribokinase
VNNNRKSKEVALIGDLCLDILMQIHEYPEKGGDGLSEKIVLQSGGSVSNTAILLARLGYRPHLFTHVGNDLWAKQVLKTLKSEEVIVDRIVHEENESTGISFIVVTPDGERTMFTHRGANTMLYCDEITAEMFSDISVLHISGYACLKPPQSDAVMKAVEIAYQKGIEIALDIGVEPAHIMGNTLTRMLPKLSLLILGEPEALAISGARSISDALKYLVEQGVKVVGLKLGKNGCQLITREKQVHVPGFVVNVVDTTGAGDAFSAGLIFGLLQHWNLEITGLFANAMGGLAATRWGAGSALPGKEEIIEFLLDIKNRTNENQPLIQELIKQLRT